MDLKDKVLQGSRISLRPLRHSDVGAIARWHDDKEIMTMISLTRTGSEEYWSEWLEKKIQSPNAITFGIVKKEDDRLIGYIHLEQLYLSQKLCRDVGLLIGEKSEWSKGYGTEALELLVGYAFGELGLHRLELMTFAFNTRGNKAWERVGFRQEGVMRRARLANGIWTDMILYAMLEDEYRARK